MEDKPVNDVCTSFISFFLRGMGKEFDHIGVYSSNNKGLKGEDVLQRQHVRQKGGRGHEKFKSKVWSDQISPLWSVRCNLIWNQSSIHLPT